MAALDELVLGNRLSVNKQKRKQCALFTSQRHKKRDCDLNLNHCWKVQKKEFVSWAVLEVSSQKR